MSILEVKRYGIMLGVVCTTAVVFSVLWKVPYLYTLMGFSVWAFAVHVITIDDLSNGWSDPDSSIPFPWEELAIKAALLLGFLGLIFSVPTLRTLGI